MGFFGLFVLFGLVCFFKLVLGVGGRHYMAGHLFLALTGGISSQNKTIDMEASPSVSSLPPLEIHSAAVS